MFRALSVLFIRRLGLTASCARWPMSSMLCWDQYIALVLCKYSVLIDVQGAHHLDLRASNPADPDSVVVARNIHRLNIRNWLQQYSKAHP